MFTALNLSIKNEYWYLFCVVISRLMMQSLKNTGRNKALPQRWTTQLKIPIFSHRWRLGNKLISWNVEAIPSKKTAYHGHIPINKRKSSWALVYSQCARTSNATKTANYSKTILLCSKAASIRRTTAPKNQPWYQTRKSAPLANKYTQATTVK